MTVVVSVRSHAVVVATVVIGTEDVDRGLGPEIGKGCFEFAVLI